VAGSCEHSNEYSGSIKGSSQSAKRLLASQGLCCMELVYTVYMFNAL
jgi:hypothetical protein